MPISAAGSSAPKRRGFTLIELLVVLAIVAIAAAGVIFALPDPVQSQLEREATRLAALLEAARAQSRASGAVVVWQPAGEGFRFQGLPEGSLPERWLDAATRADSAPIVLGPEPVIAAQSLRLHSTTESNAQVRLASDGLGPFVVQTP